MNEDTRYVKITEKYFRKLLESEDHLNVLEADGVDNWEGYSRFGNINSYEEFDEAEEKFEKYCNELVEKYLLP